MDTALLDIKNLSAWYSDRKKVLSDFSFALAEQEVAGLIGLNGAGKTTFRPAPHLPRGRPPLLRLPRGFPETGF